MRYIYNLKRGVDEMEKRVEYMCSYCGKKEIRLKSIGRPMPGKCPRRNGDMPHRWIVNRTLS